MSDEPDPKIVVSPLSTSFTEDGITVDVDIYRLEGGEGWSLELVDDNDTSIVWAEQFETDQAAWDEFQHGIRDVGLRALLNPSEDEQITVH